MAKILRPGRTYPASAVIGLALLGNGFRPAWHWRKKSRSRPYIRRATRCAFRLLEYRRIPHETLSRSRKNILIPDPYTRQYCAAAPSSRAGETIWENLVACCHPCNNRKGSRTPEEAGMKLARAPRPFSLHTSRHLMRLPGTSDDQWRKYLFY